MSDFEKFIKKCNTAVKARSNAHIIKRNKNAKMMAQMEADNRDLHQEVQRKTKAMENLSSDLTNEKTQVLITSTEICV